MNKIICFDTKLMSNTFVSTCTEINSSVNEIRRREKPGLFKQEIDWIAKGFNQPKTMLEILASTIRIDAFQTRCWGSPRYHRAGMIVGNFQKYP